MHLKDCLSLRSENFISPVLDCQPHQSDGLGSFCHRYQPFSSINWWYAILTVIISIISILNLDKHLSESCQFPDVSREPLSGFPMSDIEYSIESDRRTASDKLYITQLLPPDIQLT
jgi:hypothetical protein